MQEITEEIFLKAADCLISRGQRRIMNAHRRLENGKRHSHALLSISRPCALTDRTWSLLYLVFPLWYWTFCMYLVTSFTFCFRFALLTHSAWAWREQIVSSGAVCHRCIANTHCPGSWALRPWPQPVPATNQLRKAMAALARLQEILHSRARRKLIMLPWSFILFERVVLIYCETRLGAATCN